MIKIKYFMKNIALLTSHLKSGGAQRVVSNISKHLSDKDINVYIFLYDGQQTVYGHGGKLIDLKTPASKNIFIKILNLIKRIYKIKKLKNKYKIDTAISFLSSPNIINILTKSDEKNVISERVFSSCEKKTFFDKFYSILKKFIYNNADEIVSISNGVKEDLVSNFNIKKDKIYTIYNPCDIKYINKLKNERIEKKYKHIFKKPTIINVGRLVQQKGQKYLIEAFKHVKKTKKEAQLVILGKGPLKKDLKDKAKKLNLASDIHLLGFKKNPFKFMKSADIFTFSSLFEGFGNVIVEAMSCGLPIISTDCNSGPREIIAPNTNINKKNKNIEYAKYGLLIPDLNQNNQRKTRKGVKKTSEAIIKLLSNKSLRQKYSQASTKRALDFTPNKITQEWLKIIN